MAQETLTRVRGSAPLPRRISYEEFLSLPAENQHVEWVDGEVVEMSPANEEHQELAGFMLILISHFVEARGLGRVLFDPFQMKTGEKLPGRAPDILFVAKPNLGRLKRNYLAGPGDLVVEIISPGSGAVDRGEKFHEYERGGVPEYWLIDPFRKQAEFYQRDGNGIYRLASLSSDGAYRSRVLVGLWLNVDWLWQKPLPKLLDVLRDWNLI